MTFAVSATDTAGNHGNPNSYTWIVDATAPTITFTASPDPATSATSATFAFTASEAATLECQLDSGSWTSCTSPHDLTGLANGAHTFAVRATDTAGNHGNPTSYTSTIDTTAPRVTITSGPETTTAGAARLAHETPLSPSTAHPTCSASPTTLAQLSSGWQMRRHPRSSRAEHRSTAMGCCKYSGIPQHLHDRLECAAVGWPKWSLIIALARNEI